MEMMEYLIIGFKQNKGRGCGMKGYSILERSSGG
jgi:hypothetical protein